MADLFSQLNLEQSRVCSWNTFEKFETQKLNPAEARTDFLIKFDVQLQKSLKTDLDAKYNRLRRILLSDKLN